MNRDDSIPTVMFNGRLVPGSDAQVSALGAGFQFGQGLFETIRLRGGRPVFLDRHLKRLKSGLIRLGLDWPQETGIAERLDQVVAANPADHDVLKIIVFADRDGTGELIQTRVSRYRSEDYQRGFKLHTVAAAPPPPLVAGLKALSFLPWQLAREAAHRAGADEALLIGPDGELYEGSVSNVYLVRDGQVFTPPLSSGILPGIIREILRERAEPSLKESRIFRNDLERAEEVFVTNSILGVMPVTAWEAHTWSVDSGPITARLQEQLAEAELQDLSRPRKYDTK